MDETGILQPDQEEFHLWCEPYIVHSANEFAMAGGVSRFGSQDSLVRALHWQWVLCNPDFGGAWSRQL